MTSILCVVLLLAMTGITSTVAQEGTVPKETCQFLTYNFEHGFIEDPMVNITTLVGPNRADLESLKQFIIVDEDCSIATDLKIFEITHDKGVSNLNLPTITQRIKIQVSAQSNITSPTEKSTQLNLCLESVTRRVGSDTQLANSVPLNSTVNGTVNGLIRSVTLGQESCCQAIFGSSESICCRPGFMEDGDNCACSEGKFLNLNETSCDDCPEDTYQPNNKTRKCLPCPKGTTTYGATGANSISFCLEACQPGSFYNIARGSCELCPQSSFQTKQGQFNCTPCDAEKITIYKGSKTQEDCITNCSRGTFLNRETEKCEVCPFHTYQPKFGTTKCIDCPDGRITVNTSSYMLENCIQNCSAGSVYNFLTKDCENCPLSTYQPKSGQTKCIVCPTSKITVNVSTVRKQDCIKECRPGERYNHQSFECVSCPPNTYKPTKGETECIKCPNGTVTYTDRLHINITDCGEVCNPGYYFNITSSSCAKCPRNTTQKHSGQKTCNECILNDRLITENEGTVSESDCIAVCEAGYFFNKTILTCESCKSKTYQPNPGTSKCLNCPDNYTTVGEGSTDINQCVKACPPGSHHVNKTQECSVCEKGKYQNKWGQDTCKNCVEDKTTLQEGSIKSEDCFEVCFEGNFFNVTSKRCQPCPVNSYQNLDAATTCPSCPNNGITRGTGTRSLKECTALATTVRSSGGNVKLVVPVLSTVVVLLVCTLVIV